MERLAIIGSGIAGLGCAHFLHRHFDISVYERNDYAGGHSNTLTVRESGTGNSIPIDTGFMVFNRVTYPLLCRFFDSLEVPAKKTDMSFSVRDHVSGIEWCGSSVNNLFAQRRNLFSPRFLRMLLQIDRFNREAIAALDEPEVARQTLGAYVVRRGYGRDFLDLYLIPMSAAVWSATPERMLDFPVSTLLRFFHNHGFLGLRTQHQWWTIEGGAQEYVRRLRRPWQDRIQLGRTVSSVERARGEVAVITSDGKRETFDKVVIATHADQALRLLAHPTGRESNVLGSFRYQQNTATLHTDASVMPRTRRAWASWNYESDYGAGQNPSTATHYWMNRLQGVSDREDYFVSINRPEFIEPRRVLRRMVYAHPLFDLAAISAQRHLPHLNERARGTTETYFAGSYFRYGFHEDAFMSAVEASRLLLGRDPWTATDSSTPTSREVVLHS